MLRGDPLTYIQLVSMPRHDYDNQLASAFHHDFFRFVASAYLAFDATALSTLTHRGMAARIIQSVGKWLTYHLHLYRTHHDILLVLYALEASALSDTKRHGLSRVTPQLLTTNVGNSRVASFAILPCNVRYLDKWPVVKLLQHPSHRNHDEPQALASAARVVKPLAPS